jgi:hypothetical protein
VFTARYGLIPYLKQISLRLSKVKQENFAKELSKLGSSMYVRSISVAAIYIHSEKKELCPSKKTISYM